MVLENFVTNHHIQINKDSKITNSEEFGYGIYVNVPQLLENSTPVHEDDHSKRYEILRIPKISTLSITSCIQLCQNLSTEHKDIINSFIREFISGLDQRQPSETLILTIYVVFFTVLMQNGDKIIKNELGEYLDILSKTKIETPLLELLENEKSTKQYYDASPNENWETVEKDSQLFKLIEDSIPSDYQKISFFDFLHLKIVIRSRVLEIPELINTEDAEEDDFTVNTTLVPILDFVNHDNDLQNSWFDIDRTNNDILLIYEFVESKHLDIKDLQLYISYSPIEDIRKFSFIYGFIPRSQNARKTIELSIDRNWFSQKDHELYLFCKWFKILPNIQFVIHFDDDGHLQFDFLNLSNNLMFLIFLEDLKLLENNNSMIKQWEEDLNQDIIELPPSRRFKVKNLTDLENPIAIVESLEEEEIDNLLSRFIEFVKNYLDFKIEQLSKLAKKHNSCSHELVLFEIDVFRSFLNAYERVENKLELIAFDEEYDEYKMVIRSSRDPSELLSLLEI